MISDMGQLSAINAVLLENDVKEFSTSFGFSVFAGYIEFSIAMDPTVIQDSPDGLFR